MATNPNEDPPAPTRAQQLASIFGKTRTAVTGSDDVPLRVIVLFAAAVLFVFLGQFTAFYWWATPGALLCLMLLALSWPGTKHK